ncbi:MAG: GTP-binding protein [Methanomicrobiales archaeon]|nr:GTP-binding protein [Methanomicrobiales archaeon]
MEFEQIPTVPTAEEVLDRAFRRAAAKRREKINKDRGNEEFVRAVTSAIFDKLDDTVRRFPSFDNLSPFYRETANILFGIDRIKRSLGAVAWAADQVRTLGSSFARDIRHAEDTAVLRRRAVARISSIVHQVDADLRFLNDVRNSLRKLPDVADAFTVVIAGFPNVGKSSFIRQVSSADPDVAGYAFTTKQVIVGHRALGRERVQFVDTPGVLDRPSAERNAIEQQAMTAITHIADVILFIIDASEACGYPLADQLRLLDEIRSVAGVPVEAVVNKADLSTVPGYPHMSTATGDGVEEVLELLLRYRESSPMSRPPHTPAENQ